MFVEICKCTIHILYRYVCSYVHLVHTYKELEMRHCHTMMNAQKYSDLKISAASVEAFKVVMCIEEPNITE